MEGCSVVMIPDTKKIIACFILPGIKTETFTSYLNIKYKPFRGGFSVVEGEVDWSVSHLHFEEAK